MPFALFLWFPLIVLVSYLAATAIVWALPWLLLAALLFVAFLVLGAWVTK